MYIALDICLYCHLTPHEVLRQTQLRAVLSALGVISNAKSQPPLSRAFKVYGRRAQPPQFYDARSDLDLVLIPISQLNLRFNS